MRYVKMNLCLVLVAVLLFAGCNASGRDYHEDIILPLENSDGELVIKEWSFLMGSGAEIYYRSAGEMVLLGKTAGADDGYCPFADGKYSISEDGNTITVRWLSSSDIWGEEQFTLPD